MDNSSAFLSVCRSFKLVEYLIRVHYLTKNVPVINWILPLIRRIGYTSVGKCRGNKLTVELILDLLWRPHDRWGCYSTPGSDSIYIAILSAIRWYRSRTFLLPGFPATSAITVNLKSLFKW